MYAEKLKVSFGSALAKESSELEVVAIPSLRGQPPKEITVKNLAHIIESRMTIIHFKATNWASYDIMKLSEELLLQVEDQKLKQLDTAF